MGPKAIEWRSVNKGAWHLFIRNKSICNRSYSNGKYECNKHAPDGVNVCKFCKKLLPDLKKRINEVTKPE